MSGRKSDRRFPYTGYRFSLLDGVHMTNPESRLGQYSPAEAVQSVIDGFTTLDEADDARFWSWAEDVMAHQRAHCSVYGRLDGFRYLPVQAFKMATVASFPLDQAEKVFVSSGTGNQQRSRHHVRDLAIYERSVLAAYDRFIAGRFGWTPGDVSILGHLPAYAGESSLVAMVSLLMEERGSGDSAFFLDNRAALSQAQQSGAPVLLFGAAFGLLDLLEKGTWPLPEGSVVIETGGMKTHRREIGRQELHGRLAAGFDVPGTHVVSEYGMCELMSQAYSDEHGVFRLPPWVRFEILNPDNGQARVQRGERGILALMDLANVHTVSAILTEDLATEVDGGFVIHGRQAEAGLRGCNFLLESG